MPSSGVVVRVVGAWVCASMALPTAMADEVAMRATGDWDINEVCSVDDISSEDRCEYVKAVINCQSPSHINYLEVAYCDFNGRLTPVFCILLVWLAFLFINLVLVVDSRVVPNINTVAKCLGMSDSLAGMTLLALGNGAADVFSAAAAVSASENGANLAISGLLGGGLYVVAVVAGVLAYKFEPTITLARVGSDAGWYMISIAAVAIMSADSVLRLWECVLFIVLYCAYVATSLLMERVEQANQNAAKAMLDTNKPTEQTGLLAAQSTATNPTFDYADEAALVSANTGLSRADDVVTQDAVEATIGPKEIWTPSTHDGTWIGTLVRARNELLKIETESWSDKSLIFKAVTIIQLPVHLILVLANPVVVYEDRGRTWDKNRHMVLSLLMLPLFVLIFDEDTFYADNTINMPSMAVAAILGLVIASSVAASADVTEPPKYQGGFAGAGFLVALAVIYSISDEVVALLTAVGIMLSLSPSMLGMTVLGIGNGTCDLVANYLMAKAGYPSTALAAVYAGPMFNLMFGLGVSGIAGAIQYGHGLPVVAEVQIYIGVIFITMILALGVLFSHSGQFTKKHGVTFFCAYGVFLAVTLAVNLS
eukprot:m.63616 g.63616  ORF g.63616 m.63616 type:complete len:595 (-) comp8166_c0_seq1:2052-3836(-)